MDAIAQQMTLAEEPDWTAVHQWLSPFWRARARALAHVQTACAPFRRACEHPDFVGDCIHQQNRIIQDAQKERQQANDQVQRECLGRCPLILELADPWQMRPLRTVSLFDSQDMLKQRVAQAETVSIESAWGIKAFNNSDCAFELTAT